MKNSQISKRLGVSESTISHTLNDPGAKKIIDKALKESLGVDR